MLQKNESKTTITPVISVKTNPTRNPETSIFRNGCYSQVIDVSPKFPKSSLPKDLLVSSLMLQPLLQVVLEWLLGVSTPSHRVFGALGHSKNIHITFLERKLVVVLGGGFKSIFYFHPYLGKIPILTNIFQMGWFNHQLVVWSSSPIESHSPFFPRQNGGVPAWPSSTGARRAARTRPWAAVPWRWGRCVFLNGKCIYIYICIYIYMIYTYIDVIIYVWCMKIRIKHFLRNSHELFFWQSVFIIITHVLDILYVHLDEFHPTCCICWWKGFIQEWQKTCFELKGELTSCDFE